MKNAAEHAATLTRQLLAFSRRQVLQPVDVDLGELVRDLRRLLERVLPEHIELRLQSASPAPVVHADVRQMEQVVINLCVNARDAMPRGGSIEIETRLLEASDPSLAGKAWVERERYGELVIRDSGEGIPPGRDRSHLRALLHHQGRGAGNRPRSRDGVRYRAPARRGRSRSRASRGRGDLPHLPSRRRATGPAPPARGLTAGAERER